MKHRLSLKNKLMFAVAVLISGSAAGMNSQTPAASSVQTPDSTAVTEGYLGFDAYMESFNKMCKGIPENAFEFNFETTELPKTKVKLTPHENIDLKRQKEDLDYIRSTAENYFSFWEKIDDLIPVIMKKVPDLISFLTKCREENQNLPRFSNRRLRSYASKLRYIFDNRNEILKTVDALHIVPDASTENYHKVLNIVLPNYKSKMPYIAKSAANDVLRLNNLKYLRTEAEKYLDFWKKIDDITPAIMKKGLFSFLKYCRQSNERLPNFFTKDCYANIRYLFDNRDAILEAVSKMNILPNLTVKNDHNILRIIFPDHILEGSELIPVDTLDAILNQIEPNAEIDPAMELDDNDRRLALDKASSSILRRQQILLEEISRFFPAYKQEDIVAFIELCREKNPILPKLSFYHIREKIGALMYICDNSFEICKSMVVLEPERAEEIINIYSKTNKPLGMSFSKAARYIVEHDGKIPSIMEQLI